MAPLRDDISSITPYNASVAYMKAHTLLIHVMQYVMWKLYQAARLIIHNQEFC